MLSKRASTQSARHPISEQSQAIWNWKRSGMYFIMEYKWRRMETSYRYSPHSDFIVGIVQTHTPIRPHHLLVCGLIIHLQWVKTYVAIWWGSLMWVQKHLMHSSLINTQGFLTGCLDSTHKHTQTHKLSPVLHQNVSEHVSQDRDVLYKYRHAAKINIQ